MKKFMLGLSLISSFCFADIALQTKITLIDSEQRIEKDILFTTEPGKQSEVTEGDFRIVVLVTPKDEKYLCEIEIYQLDKLISKPVLLITKDVPGTVKLGERKGDGSEKALIFSISVE